MTTQARGEKRTTKQLNRREEITVIIQKYAAEGVTPSYRAMKTLLYKRGTEASHVTIKADYEALGIVSDGKANLFCISVARSQQPALALSATC